MYVRQDFSDRALFFRSTVMRCWWWHTWPHFLVLCWLEWKVAALCCFQPIQFKVKWCVLSEMSFCTLLLYWAVTYLRPVEQDLPLSLPWLLSRATGVVTLKAASDIQCSLLKLSYSFHFLIFIFFIFLMHCPVKKKRSGIIWTDLRSLTWLRYVLFLFIWPLVDI